MSYSEARDGLCGHSAHFLLSVRPGSSTVTSPMPNNCYVADAINQYMKLYHVDFICEGVERPISNLSAGAGITSSVSCTTKSRRHRPVADLSSITDRLSNNDDDALFSFSHCDFRHRACLLSSCTGWVDDCHGSYYP
jgi:hypothetical protein